jgi:hypothetical protein
MSEIKKKNRNNAEQQTQIAIVQWAKKHREQYPVLRWLHHIPNGEKRNMRTGAILKLMGVESGVWDLFLPAGMQWYHGLYIEVKATKGKLSEKQTEFQNFVLSQKFMCVVVMSKEEGIKALKQYLSLK